MGLTTFSGDFPTKKDIGIAKNYLTEDKLKILNRLVSGYFEIAEMQAMKHKPIKLLLLGMFLGIIYSWNWYWNG